LNEKHFLCHTFFLNYYRVPSGSSRSLITSVLV
jgi:hypothetical protein